MQEIECIIWCPSCRVDKFEVQRVPTRREGVFEHKSVELSENGGYRQVCNTCQGPLERKPDG